jgi:hypothetical protein
MSTFDLVPFPSGPRRVKLFRISGEFLTQLFTPGEHNPYQVVENAIPDGTRVLNVRYGWPAWIELLLEHESFEEVKNGEEVPALIPLVTTSPGTSKTVQTTEPRPI